MRSIRVIAIGDVEGNLATLWHEDRNTADFVFAALQRLNRGTRFRARMVEMRVDGGLSDEQVNAKIHEAANTLFDGGRHTLAEAGAPTLKAIPDLSGVAEPVLVRLLAEVDGMDVYSSVANDHGWDPLDERKTRLYGLLLGPEVTP